MLKKISIKFFFYTLILLMLAINLVFFYQINKNKDILSNFQTEFLKVVSENDTYFFIINTDNIIWSLRKKKTKAL